MRLLLALMLLFTTAATAQTIDDPRVRPFIPELGIGVEDLPISHLPNWVFEGNVYIGRPDAWQGAPDFLWRYQEARPTDYNHPNSFGSPKLHVRSLVTADLGDPPDIIMARAGPGTAMYNGEPLPTEPTSALGSLQWMAWGGRCDEGYGWRPGCFNQGRNAHIYARSIGEQTGQSRAGELFLGTAPLGNPGNPLNRIQIMADGEIRFWRQDGQNVYNTIFKDTPLIDGASGVTATFRINGTTVQRLIEAGPPNSCGTGYRCMRILN